MFFGWKKVGGFLSHEAPWYNSSFAHGRQFSPLVISTTRRDLPPNWIIENSWQLCWSIKRPDVPADRQFTTVTQSYHCFAMQGSAFIQFHERKFLSSLLKSCEIEVVEITDNGLVKSISVFQRNNVSVWDLENYDYFPLYSALFVRIPDRILPQDTSCCEDTWILHPGPLKGSIYTSIHTGQLHYVNLFFWLIIVKTKVKVRWNSILSVQFSEEKKSEVNSRQQVLPCAVEENHQELVF